MTTMNNSQTTSIWTAPKFENSSTIKNTINRLKSAAARFWESYCSALENGQFYIPMPESLTKPYISEFRVTDERSHYAGASHDRCSRYRSERAGIPI